MSKLFGTKKAIGIKEAGIGLVATKLKESNAGLVPMNSDETNLSMDTSVIGTEEDDFEDSDEIMKYEHAYKNCVDVGTAIDIQSEQSTQKISFVGPDAEELTKWADAVNLELWAEKAIKRFLKHGKCYGELVPFSKVKKYEDFKTNLKNPLDINKLLPTETMGKIKSINSVYPSHFLQRTNLDTKIYWGDSQPKKYPQAIKGGNLNDIYYFEWNDGLSMIHSSLLLVQIKDQAEGDIPTLIRRYVAPIIDISIGDENNPPDDSDVDAVKSQVEDIYADTEFAHSYLVQTKVLGFQGKMVDTAPLFNHLNNSIQIGVQTPLDLFFGEKDSGAETKLRNFGRHIKFIQRTFKEVVEDTILFRMTGNRLNKIEWGFNEEREKEAEIDIIRGLKTDGIITPQKANDLLPQKYQEQLPEEMKNPIKNDLIRSPQAKGADGMKDRHNKTDPTKTSTAEPGKRVDKATKPIVLKRSQ